MMTGGTAQIDGFRVHGGRIDLACAVFGGKAADWIDLSTGISPWTWQPLLDPASLTALPDPGRLAGLEQAACDSFGAHDGLEVVAVPGSDLALRLIARLFPTGQVALVRPGYSGHAAIWEADRLHRISADDMGDAASTHDLLLFANPNNPDGRVIDVPNLIAAARTLARRSGWLIVDEAFADMDPVNSLAGQKIGNTIILRSFGKFFGLPGLRLGFVLAPPAIARQLRAWLGDWPVSGPAIDIATAAYRDRDWQRMHRARLTSAGMWLDATLREAGMTVRGDTALFRLLETEDAEALFRHFAAHRILTRPFFGDARRLRIGLPGGAVQQARFQDACEEWEQ